MTKYTNLWTLALIAALCGCNKDKPKKHMDNQVAETQHAQQDALEEAENNDGKVIDSPQNMTTAYPREEEEMNKTPSSSMITADNEPLENESGLV